MENREIEVRFLEIDKEALINKALSLGAKDLGEVMLEEIIFYNTKEDWRTEHKLVKIRNNRDKITVTYKHFQSETIDGTEEIEFEINNKNSAKLFLERLGLTAYREQQKLRHTLELDGVTLDIDTWPRIPTYIELESNNEQSIRDVALKLGLDWKDVLFEKPGKVIEERYNIPVTTMRYFTFDRFE
ncbi:MAG: hypothetical protein JWP09_187 [Candidatus Taylorbacteria bacterium]|nr:hypothetical protein [Candidatus Taylorbacteria bacterium]